MRLLLFTCFLALGVSGCSNDGNGEWQTELLLQLDELRQEQINLRKEFALLKKSIGDSSQGREAQKSHVQSLLSRKIYLGTKMQRLPS